METTQTPDEKTLTQWGRTRLAHQGVMLEDAQRTLAADREATKEHQRKTLGHEVDVEDDMGVHIGDTVVNHTQAPRNHGMSYLGKAAAVALGLGAFGLGFGIPVALMLAKERPTVVDTDTDTQYQIGFIKDDDQTVPTE